MTRAIQHYTVETGHCHDSPRSEVGDDVLATLQPMLRPGHHDVPGLPGYRGRVTIEGTTLAATVLAPTGAPLVTCLVCVTVADVSAAIAMTGSKPAVVLAPPCVVVTMYPTVTLDQDAMSWLGDFERCLAWAWVDQRERAR